MFDIHNVVAREATRSGRPPVGRLALETLGVLFFIIIIDILFLIFLRRTLTHSRIRTLYKCARRLAGRNRISEVRRGSVRVLVRRLLYAIELRMTTNLCAASGII